MGEFEVAAGEGQREMDLGGQNIRKPVQCERRLMGEHALRVSPQPCCDQLFLLAGWEVDEAVDPATYPSDASGLLVMREQRGRIAGGRGLLGGEEAFLGGGDVV
jgi:hypothetical protein